MRLCIHLMVTGVCPVGFPHSDIHGSMPACGSPWLFAAYHVLRRQSVPRHPPCALICLISSPKRPFDSRNSLASASCFRSPLSLTCSAPPGRPVPLPSSENGEISRLQCPCFFLCSFQGAIFRLFPSPRSAFASRASVLCRYFIFTLRSTLADLRQLPFPSRSRFWWAEVDSNHRPRAYQARALTN